MTLTHILVFIVISLLAGWVVPHRWRVCFLAGASLVAVYWLQTSTPIRNLDFWLPSVSIFLTVFVWATTHPEGRNMLRSLLCGALLVLGIPLLAGATRYMDAMCCLTPTRPPEILPILFAIGVAFVITAIPYLLLQKRLLTTAAFILILGLFLILKGETLAKAASAWLRAGTGQATELANALDIPWLGFSYLAFRLLHVLRDSQTGKLPPYRLDEFVTYAIFFPAYTAGPIDRSQRFIDDIHRISAPGDISEIDEKNTFNLIQGGQRILLGIFKKFVLADSLALIALNQQNVTQTHSTPLMWILLYAYALRIYFDFAGYTDIAIGLGQLVGFHLPENFNRPYLKQNLTAFWNCWHITLAQWFRAYFFNPVTRALRSRPQKLPPWMVILIGQASTMMLIGLWHGLTWNFLIWGAWHGLGLFVHNRWLNWIRPRLGELELQPALKWGMQFSGWFLTFQFVTLGWVWFALPEVELALDVFSKLAGF